MLLHHHQLSQPSAMNAKEKSNRKSIWWKSKLKVIFPPSFSIVGAFETSSGCTHADTYTCLGARDSAGEGAPRGGCLADWARALLLVLKTLRGCQVVPLLFLMIDCNDFSVQGLESDSALSLIQSLMTCDLKQVTSLLSYLWNWKIKGLTSLLWEFKGFHSWKCILQCPAPKCSMQLLPWTSSDLEPGNECESRLDSPFSTECKPTHLWVRIWNMNEKGT